jgi:hypothetical protein
MVHPASEHVEECIKLTIHGVTEPSDEIKKDLVNVFQKRLDDYTLEMITIALSRNPNTKLALQDVQVRLIACCESDDLIGWRFVSINV